MTRDIPALYHRDRQNAIDLPDMPAYVAKRDTAYKYMGLNMVLYPLNWAIEVCLELIWMD